MTDWLYPYPPLLSGTLLKRYKRFFADIQLDSGEEITAHCPNTGPMTGICTPGNRVLVSRSNSKTRTLPYTWEAIEVHDTQPTWAGVNTALPNRVIKAALTAHLFPSLGNYTQIRGEVPYGLEGKSRIDFLLTAEPIESTVPTHETELIPVLTPETSLPSIPETRPIYPETRPIYIEVKNTTWTQGELALFPDTVTTRGQKHLRELTALLPQTRAVMLYFINRGDCTQFSPGDSADPVYGKLLREAIALGLEVLPCRFEVTPEGLRYLGLAELVI